MFKITYINIKIPAFKLAYPNRLFILSISSSCNYINAVSPLSFSYNADSNISLTATTAEIAV